MKRHGYVLLVFLFVASLSWSKDVSVLMIGNSFSICVGRNLPRMVQENGKHHLKLTSLYIGGCELKRHWENLGADPKVRPMAYRKSVWDSSDAAKSKVENDTLMNTLKSGKYDVVTLQQASHRSWQKDSYEPYVKQLVEAIRKYQPQAEIVIQQTWSYRKDDRRIAMPKPGWGFDQKGMYERLESCYRTVAERYGFRVIPTGKAVQLTRETLAQGKAPRPDVVGNVYTYKDPKTGQMKQGKDTIHLNDRGEYLQGCVWFGLLFGEDVEGLPNGPRTDSKDAIWLRRCAAQALKDYQQVKK